MACLGIPRPDHDEVPPSTIPSKRPSIYPQFSGRNEVPPWILPSNVALAQTAAKELTILWRTSAPYEHQSQLQEIHKVQVSAFTKRSLLKSEQLDLTLRKYNATIMPICNLGDGACRCEAHHQQEAGNSQSLIQGQKIDGMWIDKSTSTGEHSSNCSKTMQV
eukprot:1959642-Amphidinium_carterae.3